MMLPRSFEYRPVCNANSITSFIHSIKNNQNKTLPTLQRYMVLHAQKLLG
jgi:hypothetical protein